MLLILNLLFILIGERHFSMKHTKYFSCHTALPTLHVINFAACHIIHYLYEQGLVLPSPIMTASLTSETSLFSKGTANRNKLSTILGEGGCGKNDKKLYPFTQIQEPLQEIGFIHRVTNISCS